ncbi:hypothetical protein ACTXT7_012771 [Hymenolepis weldensis]
MDFCPKSPDLELKILCLREVAKVNPEQKTEINNLRSENSRLRQSSDGMREQVAQLQAKASFVY